LETVFLIDYFAGDRILIERWRFADKKARIKDFGPVKVREALDARDGFTEKKRFATYEMFSELAGHPTMKSAFMMRPQPDGEAVIGPFVEVTTLEAVVSEMGRLAIQVGEQLNLSSFRPTGLRGLRASSPSPSSSSVGSQPSTRALTAQLRNPISPRAGDRRAYHYDLPDIQAQTWRQKPGVALGRAG
jgi:hypothetical protein